MIPANVPLVFINAANRKNFFFEIVKKHGNPRESDYISNLLRDLLQRLKFNSPIVNSESGDNPQFKENVLIIDDIDRLDPEHIFRLLNIFSVNFGKEEVLNKFQFDKIIFVCDIDNIRSSYAHKYGENVDFEGYIDKFYSVAPYRFEISDLIKNFIGEFIENFGISEDLIDFSKKREVIYDPNFVILSSFINTLLSARKINLRTLLNTRFFKNFKFSFSFTNRNRYYSEQFPIITLFYFLETAFDTTNEVESLLLFLRNKFDSSQFYLHSRLSDNFDSANASSLIISTCIPFLIDGKKYDEVQNNTSSSEEYFDFLPVLNCFVKYRYSRNHYYRSFNEIEYIGFYKDETFAEEVSVNVFEVVYQTYLRYNRIQKLSYR